MTDVEHRLARFWAAARIPEQGRPEHFPLVNACEPRDLHGLTVGEIGAGSHGEVPHMRWEDIDLEGGFLRVRSHADLRAMMGYIHLAREHLRSLVDGADEEREMLKRDLGNQGLQC